MSIFDVFFKPRSPVNTNSYARHPSDDEYSAAKKYFDSRGLVIHGIGVRNFKDDSGQIYIYAEVSPNGDWSLSDLKEFTLHFDENLNFISEINN